MAEYICISCGNDVIRDDTMMGGGDCICRPFPPTLIRIGSAEWQQWRKLEDQAAARALHPMTDAEIEEGIVALYGPKKED